MLGLVIWLTVYVAQERHPGGLVPLVSYVWVVWAVLYTPFLLLSYVKLIEVLPNSKYIPTADPPLELDNQSDLEARTTSEETLDPHQSLEERG